MDVQTAQFTNYTIAEEVSHAVSHGIGAIMSIAGLVVLVTFSSLYGNIWHIVSCSIYGATLIFMFVSSTIYHSVYQPRFKLVLRKIDHAAIFLLIAGTYTPFALVSLREYGGWWIFGAVWGIAILGLMFEIVTLGKYKKVSIALYVGLGWIIIVAIKPLLTHVPPGGLWLLFMGGAMYTIGVVFYSWKTLPYHHLIWHLFVLGGSISHYLAILFFVIPF